MSLLLLASSAHALQRVDHPDPAGFAAGVAETLRQAQESFRASQNDGVPSGDDYGRLAMVYHAHEQYLPARQAYRNAAELSPTDARWPFFLGILAADDGEFERAVAYFEESLKANPDYAATRLRLARALVEAGRHDRARQILESLVADDPELAAAHADLGTLAAQRGDHAAAIAHLERALALQPDATRLHYQLGLAHRGLGNVEQARAHLQQQGDREAVFDDRLYRRMRSLSASFTYYVKLGQGAAEQGDYATALEMMRTAAEIAPDNPEARINYARMLAATDQLDAGLAELDRVLETDPDNALALFNRGALLEIRGDDAASRQALQQAVAVQPDMYEAHVLLGNGMMRAGNHAAAAQHYAAAYAARPARNELLLHKAVAQRAGGDCGAAMATLMEVVRALPENLEVLLAYSRVAATCPDVGEEHLTNALNASRNMYRLKPELPMVTTLALIEAAHGDFDAAIEYQGQALFMAVRDGLESEMPYLKATMKQFQDRQLPTAPWPPGSPLLSPPRLTSDVWR